MPYSAYCLFLSLHNLVPRARDLQEKNRELWDPIIHNREPEILAFFARLLHSVCINNQSDSPRFMDYPRALDSSLKIAGSGYEIGPSKQATRPSLLLDSEMANSFTTSYPGSCLRSDFVNRFARQKVGPIHCYSLKNNECIFSIKHGLKTPKF